MDESISLLIYKDDISLQLSGPKWLLCERLPMLDVLLDGKFSITKNEDGEIMIGYPSEGLELLCEDDIIQFILKKQILHIEALSLETFASLNRFLDYFSASSLRKMMAEYVVQDLVFRVDESDWIIFIDLLYDLFASNMLPPNWISPRVEMSPIFLDKEPIPGRIAKVLELFK